MVVLVYIYFHFSISTISITFGQGLATLMVLKAVFCYSIINNSYVLLLGHVHHYSVIVLSTIYILI